MWCENPHRTLLGEPLSLKRSPKNVPHSVKARLLQGAKERQENFNVTLARYVMERFLFRLSRSPHRESFVLKGANMFLVWLDQLHRPTRDLDMTCLHTLEESTLLEIVQQVTSMKHPDDGVEFKQELQSERIRIDAGKGGFRVKLHAHLGSSRVPFQIDFGLGDAITPKPESVDYPCLLDDLPAANIRAYPQVTFIAEKFEIMVQRGEENTRTKDFYDVALLASRFPFDGSTLQRAVQNTFSTRRTPISGSLPVALRSAFYSQAHHVERWPTFLDSKLAGPELQRFDSAGRLLTRFLGPVWAACRDGTRLETQWAPGGPWS